MNVYDELVERGFVAQVTDEDALRRMLSEEQVTFYIGFDSTAVSLHAGSLVQIMAMLHLQRARIPQLDILRIATLNAAETVGADQQLGSLEVGKLADIVLLNSNPLEDIANAQDIWRVIQDGRVFSANAEVMAR